MEYYVGVTVQNGTSTTFTSNMTVNYVTPFVSAGIEQNTSLCSEKEVTEAEKFKEEDEYEAPPKHDLRIYQRRKNFRTADGITAYTVHEPEIIVNPPQHLIN